MNATVEWSAEDRSSYCRLVLDQARLFVEFGIAVIPLNYASKMPKIDMLPREGDGKPTWIPLTTKLPSDEQLRDWFDNDTPGNIAVITGPVSKNLVVLDSDDEPFGIELAEYIMGKTIENLGDDTLVAKTDRGVHIYIRTEQPVPHKDFRPGLEFEIRSENHYCVAPPSIHPSGAKYEFVGVADRVLEVTDDWWNEWRQLLDERLEEWQYIRLLIPCWMEGNRQNLTMGYTAFCRKLGFTLERTTRSMELLCMVTRDKELLQRLGAVEATYTKPIADVGVQNWLGRELYEKFKAIKPTTVKKNVIKANENPKEMNAKVPSLVLDDGTIVDEIYREGVPQYLIYKDGQCSFQPSFTHNGMTHTPLDDELLRKGIVLLPSGIEEFGDEAKLFEDIIKFIETWVEADPTDLKICGLQKMAEWLLEKIPSLPIINPRGGSDTGKTRLGNVLWVLSYRGMRVDGVLSLSSLFRNAEKWKGTLYINEADISEGSGVGGDSESSQQVKYYNSRYERNACVWRTNKDTLEPEVFNSFGPTILVSRKGFKDDALESRCIVVPMLGRTRKIPLNLTPEFYQDAERLRNKLELFRLRNLHRFENDFTLEFEGVSSRMNQVLQPMASLAKAFIPNLYPQIAKIAKDLSEKVVEERANSEDGQIVRAYLAIDHILEGVTAAQISGAVKDLYGVDIKPERVGRRARSLGFASSRPGPRKRLLKLPEDHAHRMLQKYVPAEERESYTPKALQKTFDTSDAHTPLSTATVKTVTTATSGDDGDARHDGCDSCDSSTTDREGLTSGAHGTRTEDET